MKQFYILLIAMLFNVNLTIAQSISGTLINTSSDQPIIGADISLLDTDLGASSNATGRFNIFDVKAGNYTMVVSLDDKEIYRQAIEASGADLNLGSIAVEADATEESSSEITVISLNSLTQETEEDGADFSTILTAGRDEFLSTAAFTFGSLRFNLRGLTSEFGSTYMNGVPMNELENGALYYGQWGGLNDVLRNVHVNHGLVASDYGIGGFLGNTDINVRASDQRKQTRAQYAVSNRSYTQRLMFTHSSGLNKSGFAYTVSASRRWAQEGYIPGSFYDAYSFFLGAEKQFKNGNSLHLTVLGSPSKRGKAGASLPEVIDITGDKYYNPYWGLQNGERRNSRVGEAFQPIGILGYDWNISKKTVLKSAVSFQSGRNGGTAIQWANGSNPAGDYHQKLPSRIENLEVRADVIAAIKEDPTYFQVDWDNFYNTNASNVKDDGIQSNFIVEDRRFDATEMTFNTTLAHELSEAITLNAGTNYRTYAGENFTEVSDLLGGDYFLDIDRFADAFSNPGTEQNDLNNPNRKVKVGDKFGYDYSSRLTKTAAWAQLQYRKGQLELHGGGEFSKSTMKRIGNMRNGFFPDNSFGDSEQLNFNNYNSKIGATYKLSGRQYVSANAMMSTRAPYFRDTYVNPQSNNDVLPDVENVEQKSAELTYNYRSPGFTFKTTAYYADIDNETDIFFFYAEEGVVDGSALESGGAFGSFANTNIDRRHVGVESAISYKINPSFSAKAVLAIGQHLYDSRWIQYAQSEESGFFRNEVTVYTDNFYVESSPQTAGSFELKYNSPNYWFATLNINYIGDRYLDFATDRRIAFNTQQFDVGSAEIADQVAQTKLDEAITVDLFAYKSIRVKDHTIILTASVSNLLNTDLITGGYEQARFSAEDGKDFFENKVYYGYGRNFFLGLAVRL